MKQTLWKLWHEDSGVLSFEWVLLVTLLTIGIVSGLAGARDAITDELSDIAEATISFDQSYTVPAFTSPLFSAPGSTFTDDTAADLATFTDCVRGGQPGQPAQNDTAGGG